MIMHYERSRQTSINHETSSARAPKRSSTSPRPSKNVSRFSPRQYVDAIDAFSKLSASNSLYAGLHFEDLAGYLLRPYEAQIPLKLAPAGSHDSSSHDASSHHKFVSLYDLDPAASTPVRHIQSIQQFESETHGLATEASYGQLLFMRGYPSPEWLAAIGARYSIDPDFFQRHLDFLPQKPNYFYLPSLPSSTKFMVRLRIATIGYAKLEPGTDASQETLEQLRQQNTEALRVYLKNQRGQSTLRLGDALVRHTSVHDMQHFTIEQDISIYVKRTKKSWILFVWLDNGQGLGEGLTSWLKSPLQTSWKSKIQYLPVVQHKLGIALERRSNRRVEPCDGQDVSEASITQSASLLHLDYGHDMDREIAGADSFYALHQVFTLVAFADTQFLNVLESQLASEIDQTVLIEQSNPTLSNLLYNQQILERYIQRMKNTIRCIRDCALNDWPTKPLSEDKMSTANTAKDSLLRDFEYLLERSETLCQQCDRGMQIIMNNVMLTESRKAISQSEELAKLTKLAFIFIPLSFITSFFGMNFKQLGTGSLSLWVWGALSVPVFMISILFMKFDILAVQAKLRRYVQEKKYGWNSSRDGTVSEKDWRV